MIFTCVPPWISMMTFWRAPTSWPQSEALQQGAFFPSLPALRLRLVAALGASGMAYRSCRSSQEGGSSLRKSLIGFETKTRCFRQIVIALLDVNVLVALFDPAHLHHEAAHAWFARNRSHRWATCPLTENALVRVLTNPSYPGGRTTVEDAASRLRTFCSDRLHLFWPDSMSIRNAGRFRWNHVQGHRQLTDVYLLALSVSNEGRLATFDSTISVRAVQGAAPDSLELLAA
jgi:uncharacterized protein